jgi:hypothetical protein
LILRPLVVIDDATADAARDAQHGTDERHRADPR